MASVIIHLDQNKLKMKCAVVCLTLLKITLIACQNYKLYEITAFSPRERKLLYSIYIKEDKIIFINGISNEAAIPIYAAVETNSAYSFEIKLHAFDIKFVYFSENYMLSNKNEREIENQNSGDILNSFMTWDKILNWIESQVKKNNIFQKIVIAKTNEKRDIIILKISEGNKKPIVFIAGGEDGKDWMSSSIVLNFANHLLQNPNGDNHLLKEYDFYLIPMLNPDGFEYSMSNDRFWSKNRKQFFPPVNCFNNLSAIGVNIDRNWFFHKATKILHEECKGIYIGHTPVSEEETQALSLVLNDIAINVLAFINVKGFGKFITIPYASRDSTNNRDIVMDILTSACTTLKTNYGITYYVDTTNRFIYNFTGNLADWVKDKLNIPLVFTTYLEDKKYVLPKSKHIKPLSDHFFTILNETLLVSKDIYKPLFGK